MGLDATLWILPSFYAGFFLASYTPLSPRILTSDVPNFPLEGYHTRHTKKGRVFPSPS